MRSALPLLVSALLAVPACSAAPHGREYPLQGQIIAIDREKHELTIRHGDIPGYMPAMVMSFKVADPQEVERRSPGELIAGTLVVRDLDSELKDIRVTGRAEVDAAIARSAGTPVLEPGDPVPEGAFLDEAGRARSLADWRGRTVLITFIYTRCPLPDFCPRMERNFLTVQRQMPAEVRAKAALLAVSIDPAYDTPPVLQKHARAIGADPALWHFLTGEPDSVGKFAAQFGVSVIRDAADAANITHNLRTALIDGQGRVVTVFTGNDWTPAHALSALTDAVGRAR